MLKPAPAPASSATPKPHPSTTPSRSTKPSSSPKTGNLSTAQTAADVKSKIRNILLASPYFPRFYADVVIARNPNSKLAKILAANYQKILERVNANMSVKTCIHIKVNGIRCDSPALRGESFCYFHQRMLRTVKRPLKTRIHPVALLEDEESIQVSIMEIVNALIHNQIELKRAELILRALNIAVRNVRRARFEVGSDAVTQIPDYPVPPGTTEDEEEIDRSCPSLQ